MIDYSRLQNRLKERDNTKSELGSCLQCGPEDLYEIKSDNRLLQILRDEKAAGVSGGIYHELQVQMTYNSTHMEGSKLSEEQTRKIFDSNTVDTCESLNIDDILETVHHFQAIDYCIDHAEEPLSEDIIKQLHYILKHDTRDSRLSLSAIGNYKTRANVVGGKDTTAPEQVAVAVQNLLASYLKKDTVTIEDIIAFHAEFEMIHPFQDGNGRVGRLIAFKESLKHNVIPFIIEDEKRRFYYRGLSQWNREKGYLIGTCLDGQETVNTLLAMFGIEPRPE